MCLSVCVRLFCFDSDDKIFYRASWQMPYRVKASAAMINNVQQDEKIRNNHNHNASSSSSSTTTSSRRSAAMHAAAGNNAWKIVSLDAGVEGMVGGEIEKFVYVNVTCSERALPSYQLRMHVLEPSELAELVPGGLDMCLDREGLNRQLRSLFREKLIELTESTDINEEDLGGGGARAARIAFANAALNSGGGPEERAFRTWVATGKINSIA